MIAYPLIFIVISIFSLVLLWHQGMIIPNASSAEDYPVKGIDVASYQGDIEWPQIQNQDIKFAFIKATEGSSFVDEYFQSNWDHAGDTSLRIGAYHFFSYESKGITQAQNFINTVPKDADALPPVIDVEFYGDVEKNLPEREQVEKELQDMVTLLEKHYEKRVILYTTQKAYDLYIKNSFEQCDIWIRAVFSKPSLSDDRSWTFWQYTDREKLDGYNGKEKFIDVNVFNGTEQEFEEYGY
ncbi:glycoside hydrolase family 25 protein [Planococcus sp. YIM B11945]|uniref:glycoside hydrolase family 25 protein n=1 Tax=Planococcus sp. YIM B11945 TaxID=3435410 RepID=UPI003D7E3329